MIKEKILEWFRQLKEIEQMEIALMLQIEICKKNNLDKTDKLFFDELNLVLEKLRNE